MSSIHDVHQFQRKFSIQENEEPGFLPDDRMAIRLNFMLEELLELAEACGHTWNLRPDDTVYFYAKNPATKCLPEALDGLVDLVYVALGTAAQMGFGRLVPVDARGRSPIIWWEAWRRVHEANMAKVRVTDVSQSKRGAQDDCVKPAGWVPPSFEDLLPKEPKTPKR